MTEIKTDEMDPELQAELSKHKPPEMRPLIWAFVLVSLVWLSIGFLPWFAQEGWPWNLSFGLKDKASSFGDSFGFVNSIFSALAFAGVIVAILLQREELSEQRKELIMTRHALKQSAKAQRDSQKELAEQAESNLNATLLSAIQGMQDYAKGQIDSGYHDEKEQGKYLMRLSNALRQRVLAKVLEQVENEGFSTSIKSKMEEWQCLQFIQNSCSNLGFWINQSLTVSLKKSEIVSLPHELAVTSRKAQNYDEVDQKKLKAIIDRFDEISPQLELSLRLTQDDFEPFRTWRMKAESTADDPDGLNAFHRLKNFAVVCEEASDRAKFKLKRLS